MTTSEDLAYDDHLEKLLKEQAEIAESLSILHRNAHRKYSRFTNWINIPVIIGSSVVGFTTGLDLSQVNNMNVILGIISVFIGIIKSLDSYFQLGRISETHRMVSLAYSQINKKIAVELALNRKDRISPKDMLSIVKTDVKNLEDISPLLPQDILDEYKTEFGDKYENIKKPNITNGLSPVEINKSSDDKCTLTLVADLVPQNVNSLNRMIPSNPQSNYNTQTNIPYMSSNGKTSITVPIEGAPIRTAAAVSEYRTNGSYHSHQSLHPYTPQQQPQTQTQTQQQQPQIQQQQTQSFPIDVNNPDLGEAM